MKHEPSKILLIVEFSFSPPTLSMFIIQIKVNLIELYFIIGTFVDAFHHTENSKRENSIVLLLFFLLKKIEKIVYAHPQGS